MKKELLLLVFILFQSSKLSNDFKIHPESWIFGLGPWLIASGVIVIGSSISYIEREVIVTDRYLNMIKERLNSEEYWEREQRILEENKKDIGEIITRKKNLKDIVERMEKIKAERKRKKEEAEAQKKQISERNFTNNSLIRKAVFPFFFAKMTNPNQNCNALFSSQIEKCKSLQHKRQKYNNIESIIKIAYTKYNSYSNYLVASVPITPLDCSTEFSHDCYWSA